MIRIAKLSIICGVIISCLVFTAPKIYSDGILIPPPEVRVAIKYHKVSVTIDSQLATTRVDQVFINQSPMEIEADYIFPLPPGATVTDFVMYIGDEALKPELLDSDQARKIYEDIVRSRRDPALLEYIGRGAFRARVFPIFPWDEKRIQLEYSEVLPYDSGLSKYSYPLNTEKFSSMPLEEVEVAIDLTSHVPIKSIWSPSHENSIFVERQGDYSAKIIYADEYVTPDIDFILYYTVSEDDFGLNLMTYREPPEDGFYVLMAAPNYEVSTEEIVNKNVIFVFDTSGSMGRDNKIDQAKEALEFSVRKLNPGDQFNIIDFSTGVRKFESEPVYADTAEIQSAVQYIRDLDAAGGTNINEALIEGFEQVSLASNSLSMVIFLTDGLPTVGATSEENITKNARTANEMEARLFTFGVGYDVNTHLLDELASGNGGVSAYVRPEEDIEITISSFFAKVSNPVLSNPALDFGAINTVDRYPTQLPDLFAGSQLKEFGRYRNSGGTIITLAGLAAGTVKEFTYQARFPTDNQENDFIPRIWAARKVGYLIEEVSRNGETPELVDEIKALSLKYGIVNEYVSMLILEDEPLPPGAFEEQFAADTGKGAVDASTGMRDQKETNVAQSGAQGEDVRIVGSRIFVNKDGVWTDAEYEEGRPTINIEYASNGYFNMVATNPDLGKYFALGNNVIFLHDGEFYQVQDSPVETIKGDLDGNGVVNVFDLVIVAINFGESGGSADINGDGQVDVLDLTLVVQYFGQSNKQLSSAAPSSQPSKTSIDIATEMAKAGGDSLIMEIRASSVQELYGFQFDMSFDPELLEVVEVQNGNALDGDSGSSYWLPPNIDNSAGKITGAACVRTEESIDLSKAGVLALITFMTRPANTEGSEDSIRLAEVKLSDSKGHPIGVSLHNVRDEVPVSEPNITQLWQNYPNPFNPDTWIPYSLIEDSDVVIKIYDVNGILVRKLELGHKTAGVYKTKTSAAFWDGKNSSGEDLSSGIYFYSLEADGFKSVKKMTLKK